MASKEYIIKNIFVANVCKYSDFAKVSNNNGATPLLWPTIVRRFESKSDDRIITKYRDIFEGITYTSYFNKKIGKDSVIVRDIFPIINLCDAEELKSGKIGHMHLLEIYKDLLLQNLLLQHEYENNGPKKA